MNNDKKEIIKENKRHQEELHSLLNENKTSLASSNEKIKKLGTEKSDLSDKISVLTKEKAKAEQELQQNVYRWIILLRIEFHIAFS